MATKIDIISGFLGAGKTTLIRKLITEGLSGEKIVVIENEFGKVGIDGAILKNDSVQVREISAGCICCSVSSDLLLALYEVIDNFHPDRIIIEPTGVALLSDVTKIFDRVKIKKDVELNMIITVIDALKYNAQFLQSLVFIEDQVRHARTIILSKTKGLKSSRVDDIIKDIRTVNHNAPIITTEWEDLNASRILSIAEGGDGGLFEHLKKEIHHTHSCYCGHHNCHEHSHVHDAPEVFESWETITAKRFSRNSLYNILAALNNTDEYGIVLRGKGIIQEADGSWIHFDYVSGEISIENHEADYSGRICIIGINLNKNNIAKLFES